MGRRYLFGPVDEAYAGDNLQAARDRGDCLVFAPRGRPDVLVREGDAWDDVVACLPHGWRPDFVVLFLAYTSIPSCIWDAPVPRIGLAADWNVLWHRYRYAVPRCDLVVTDAPGARALRRAGASHVVQGNLFGCARAFLDGGEDEACGRDIDVLYVGSLHPAHKRDRLPWLGRVVRALGDDWNVVVRNELDRTEYLRLLRRSRIVFNRSVRGECNLRTFEAVTAGALLFQEAGNEEVPRYLRHGRECVAYTETTIEPLLRRYLADEPLRTRVAATARARVESFGFESLWENVLVTVDRRWAEIERRSERSYTTGGRDGLRHRFWEAFTASTGPDRGCAAETALIGELETALGGRPDAELHTMLGLAVARRAQRLAQFDDECVARVARDFRRAVELAPERAMLRLNLAEALWRLGRRVEAAEHCEAGLAAVDDAAAFGEDDLDLGHFPPAFDTFRVEWECAGWSAGEREAKFRLVRWRLHSVLAALTDDLEHYRAALRLRDDLWVSHAALGRALVRAREPAEGARYLRRAADLNPFDEFVLPDLLDALRLAGDAGEERAAAEELRLLRRAAPPTSCRQIGHSQEVVA
jgi:hypothetical protein